MRRRALRSEAETGRMDASAGREAGRGGIVNEELTGVSSGLCRSTGAGIV